MQSRGYLIYEYFKSRITFGCYNLYESLPSAGTTGRQFACSPQTVRKALLKIRNEGYISLSPGRRAKVIYDAGHKKNPLLKDYLLARKAGFSDLYGSVEFIWQRFMNAGIRMMGKDDIVFLEDCVSRKEADPLWLLTVSFWTILRPIKNDLLLNLFWDTVRYIRFPYLWGSGSRVTSDSDFLRAGLLRIISCIKSGDTRNIAVIFYECYSRIILASNAEAYSLGEAAGLPPQIPFQWEIWRIRTQKCYTAAASLIQKINEGIYPEGSFLPSASALAQNYGVSVMTMRRTIRLLNEISVTKTYNGRGTQVSTMNEEPLKGEKLSPEIMRNMSLSLQGLHLVCLTCGEVMRDTLANAEPADRYAFIQRLEGLLENKRPSNILPAGLNFISEKSRLAYVRTVYANLYELSAWTFPLLSYSHDLGGGERSKYLSKESLNLLRSGRFGEFADIFHKKLSQDFPWLQKHLAQLGVKDSLEMCRM